MKRSILVVDDTVVNIYIINNILGKEFNVIAATSGKEAYETAIKHKPDMIILDVILPDLDGISLCKKLKQNPLTKEIPIVYITVSNNNKTESKCLSSGGVDFITKPLNPDVVLSRIRTHLAIASQKNELSEQVRKKTEELLKSRYDLINRLGIATEYNDKTTGMHIARVSEYSVILAKKMGLSPAQINELEHAVPMHDVGKIGVDNMILRKPARLTEEEFNQIKTHTLIGSRILDSEKDNLLQVASLLALDHHEKWNGKGYPNQKSGEDIDLYARICSIVDVFDALTSKRPYKDPWDFDEAFEYIISQGGENFDPKIITHFKNSYEHIFNVYMKYRTVIDSEKT